MAYTLQDYYDAAGVQQPVAFAKYLTMPFQPRPDQILALNRSIVHNRYGLFHAPGVGKTVIEQPNALYWLSEGNKVLVLMPPVLLEQYEESFNFNFAGVSKYVNVHILKENPAKRKKLFAEWDAGEWPSVLGMSYQMYLRVRDEVRPSYDVVHADEAHALKNPESSIHKYVKAHLSDWNSTSFMPMTGTPIPNELTDAYGLISLLNPDAYASYEQFDRRHCNYKTVKLRTPKRLRGGRVQRYFKILEGYKRQDELNRHLYLNAMRVLKSDVLSVDDPTIIEVPVSLSTKHRKLYRDMTKERLIEKGDEIITAINDQEFRQRILQIVTCPELFVIEEEIKKLDNKIREAMDTILDSVNCKFDQKVIIFANFRDTVSLYVNHLQGKGLNPAVINGGTKNAHQEKLKFLNDPTCRVLVANPLSAGTGLDGLQHVCNNMIFLEPTGIPGQFQQCMDRIVRGGQQNPCTIYILKALGTVAPKATENMRRKSGEIAFVNADSASVLDYFCAA